MNQDIAKLMTAATSALNKQAYAEVQEHCKRILALDPQQADAWFFLAIVAASGRQIREAIKRVDKALSLRANDPEYLSQKAKFHTMLNENAAALAVADAAFASKPSRALILDTLGVVYTKIGEYQKARDVFALAIRKNPDNVQFQFNLASAQQFLGNMEAARDSYLAAIKLQPDFARAHWALSELEKNQADTGRFELLQALLERQDMAVEDELYLCHALSREYERSNEYAKAMQYLQRGKQRRRSSIKYSLDSDKQMFDALLQAFPEGQVDTTMNDSASGKEAIFIVGMPRSGTTLVERILASHSRVYSLGELQEFARAVKLQSGTTTPVVLDAEVISRAAQSPMAAIGSRYLQMLEGRIQTGKYFIDKMPLNFTCVGFIMRALPAAKVICLRRNPLDTCLSNYRQLFALNFSYYNYHYDLQDTAHYFAMFNRLMAHWQALFPSRFYQLSYESLTADPEQQVRSLLDHIELPWEARCLDFHKNPTAVATASTVQVRQPLYRTAVGRWQKYREQLAPAIAVLDEAGIEYE